MKNTCYSCGNTSPVEILDLGNLYLPRFLQSKDNWAPKFPLVLLFCPECKLVFLKEPTPRYLLYDNNYGYRSGINKTMRKELADIVNSTIYTDKYVQLEDGDIVVDIGANDGTLLKEYPDELFRVGWEPVKKFAEKLKKELDPTFRYVSDYFHFDSKYGLAKIITAIAMFYDLPNPHQFLEDIKKTLHPEGIFIVQQNYLVSMLNNNAFDNIIHEHLQYYSLTSFENLLKDHNLEVFDVVERDLNGGSFRAYCAHKGVFEPKTRLLAMRGVEKSIDWRGSLKNFREGVTDICDELHIFVAAESEKGKKIYIYGASNRGNTIVQAAGILQFIDCCAERNPEKYGKYFLGKKIVSEEEARQKADYFLVLPWFFAQGEDSEIVKREKEFIDNGGSLIIPLPQLQIISKNTI